MIAATAMAATLATASAVAHADTTPLPPNTSRLAGGDRYETSAAVSAKTFTAPVDTVYVATGSQYADALAGGPIAAKRSGPVLLIRKDSIPSQVAAELRRLSPASIHILGGESVISNSVVALLRQYAPTVKRISGSDRYETAAAVSRLGWASASTVFLSSGATFADALSGGAAAAHRDAPLLLTPVTGLAPSTQTELARLRPTTVYVLGGPTAVSENVVKRIRALLPTTHVVRLSGSDRYATSAKVAETIWPKGSPAMFFATGLDYADALSGTPAAHVNEAPMLLTRTTCLPTPVYRVRAASAPSRSAILGGTGVLATTAASQECGTARYSGSGDDILAFMNPAGPKQPVIVTLTHRGERNFIVWGLDAKLENTDLLVNEIGDYDGRVLTNWEGDTTRLEIKAGGPWTVTIQGLGTARTFSNRAASGQRDDVVYWGGGASTAQVSHVGSSNFIIWAKAMGEPWGDLLVNDIGNYNGTVKWLAGPRYISVTADGRWTIAVR